MRRLLILFAVALFSSCGGCGGLAFDTHVSGKSVVQGSVLGGLLSVIPAVANFTNIDFDSNQDFKNQGVRKENVVSVKVASIRLTIESPSTADFSFLDELQIYAVSTAGRDLIAEKKNIAAIHEKSFLFDLKDVELKDHVTAPSVTLEVAGKGRQPGEDVTLTADVGLHVEAKLF